MTKEFVNPSEDLLDPKNDIAFKAMLTSNNEASQKALRHIISDFTGLKIEEVRVAENEPQCGSIDEKHVRLDVSCIFNGKEIAEVEMTMDANEDEFARIEYYLAKLYSSAKTTGIKKYRDHPEAYQISIVGNRIINKENQDPVSFYEICDLKTHKPINGKMHIIVAELKKLKAENIEQMTTAEKWAAFFKWFTDKNKTEKLNKLIETEEGLQMATSALRYASRDEITRRTIIKRDMARRDLNNMIAVAKEEGEARGEARGVVREKGEIALKSLSEGLEPSLISKLTNLSIEEIEALKSQI
ncbi:MAG: Rpn family recombination-promoting nuclease/putative transposase [Oscillospiraceae bacterium]|jgi:predicted transposase/invertase (TIGR01784 family)|nr:Rpn family recombination-promoting nuclease/putative transposase [Oscillospiraceae bacterium]